MRMQTAVLTLLVTSAVPSVGFAQLVIPYTQSYDNLVDRLDHVLPVATVTRPVDGIALADPHPGDGFVLGGATLDLKNPDRPVVAFTMTNATEMPILLSTVYVHEVRVNLPSADGSVVVACSTSPWLSHPGQGDKALQPGATVSVRMPIAPRCGPTLGATVGFLVYLQAGGPSFAESRSTWDQHHAMLRKAFEQLRSQAQQ